MSNSLPTKLYMRPTNDQIIRVKGLYYVDPADPNEAKTYFDNTAIVKATLYDQYNNPVVGCTNVNLAYVVGGVGMFAGVVSEAFAPAVGTGYTLRIVADQGAAHWDKPFVVEVIDE